MTSTEEKLARELGFRVNEKGDIEIPNGRYVYSLGPYPAKLWRKCLELTDRGMKIDLQLVEDALFIAQAVDANKDRAERMLALGERVHEMIKQQMAPAELTEQRERDLSSNSLEAWDEWAVMWRTTKRDLYKWRSDECVTEFAEAYASSRLAAVSAQLERNDELNRAEIDRLRTAYNSCAESRRELHQENATLRAELEEAQRQLKIWESNEPCPECGEDHKCGTQATVARLTGERDALREQLSEAKIAYGKLFNENAALTGQLEEHEAE